MYGSLRQNLHNFFYTDEGRTDITDYRDAIASKKIKGFANVLLDGGIQEIVKHLVLTGFDTCLNEMLAAGVYLNHSRCLLKHVTHWIV